MKRPSDMDEVESRDQILSLQKGRTMAQLATKPHLIASLNVMLAARQTRGEVAFTQDEIIEILCAMAETHAMTTNPPTPQQVHWQTAPIRMI